MNKFTSLKRYIVGNITFFLPASKLYPLKRVLWSWADVSVAKNVRIISTVKFITSGPISIGKNTFIGHECIILGGTAPIEIGADCDIAPRVTIVSGSHELGDRDKAAGKGISRPIKIENGVWIGASTTILGGVTIGEGSMIGSCSLVNKRIPPDSIAYGVPCSPRQTRYKKEAEKHDHG